jgi:hypothetical protein
MQLCLDAVYAVGPCAISGADRLILLNTCNSQFFFVLLLLLPCARSHLPVDVNRQADPAQISITAIMRRPIHLRLLVLLPLPLLLLLLLCARSRCQRMSTAPPTS